jgi:hypothetical protein
MTLLWQDLVDSSRQDRRFKGDASKKTLVLPMARGICLAANVPLLDEPLKRPSALRIQADILRAIMRK